MGRRTSSLNGQIPELSTVRQALSLGLETAVPKADTPFPCLMELACLWGAVHVLSDTHRLPEVPYKQRFMVSMASTVLCQIQDALHTRRSCFSVLFKRRGTS